MEVQPQKVGKPWMIISCLIIVGLTLFNLLLYSFPALQEEIYSSFSQIQQMFYRHLGSSA